ncbi:MAG TPA: zinc ribbon domain-containing protein [Polyangiaceae bacterium]|jgi:hypothetical protein
MAKDSSVAEASFTAPSLPVLGAAIAGVTVAVALGVGLFAGVASAMLVLVTGALLGSILLVWHSLRTLAGDAEVEPGLDAAFTASPTDLRLVETKRRALRALKDIEQDHAFGKIDDADFKSLDADYRAAAKEAIRELDAELDPWREKAEALVRAHIEKRGAERARAPSSDACPKCKTKNDPDATFCKKCGTKLESDA